MLLSLSQLEESEHRFSKIAQQDSAKATPMPMDRGIVEVQAADASPTDLKQRVAMLATETKEPLNFAFERAIGNNDSVYSNFIELILSSKRKVGRIVCRNGSRILGYATGFMVSERLLLTNWHVFQQIDSVADAEVQFFYEYDINGKEIEPVSFSFSVADFFYANQALDYCLVAVNPIDLTGKVRLKSIGSLFLEPKQGKLGAEQEERLNIIHHPDGDYKQLSIRQNLFVKITPTSIWYETDTAPGSSGSPVFNDQWQVVALHHMGIGNKNEAGDYLDKDDQIIPKINGKIDERTIVWIANEGIRVSVILNDIFQIYPDHALVNGLKIKDQSQVIEAEPNRKEETISMTPANSNQMENTNMVNVSFPSSLLESNEEISVKISKGSKAAPALPEMKTLTDLNDFNELKKLEDQMDFSDCEGYVDDFLGQRIPLPKPLKPLQKFIAVLNSNKKDTELKYDHYSVVFHSVRRMPVISAVNVDGDLQKRQDKSERKDNWLRDNRIDYSIQLNDQYYKNSNFDRGHMSRREDANWGDTPEIAKRNADRTCMYTNACPQVAALNQSKKKGLWGELEKVVLENGATKEGPHTNKITVFNGPIFKESDPVFRGVQVPLSFYKVIFWLTDAGILKATGFKLSQENLVEDIDFEQLNIDENLVFKKYRIGLKSLQEDTGLDFSGFFSFDTFSSENTSPVEIDDKESELSNEINTLSR